MLEHPVPLDTGLPGPVSFRRLTSADAHAFAAHVAGDLPRLAEHLPWPEPTCTSEGARRWLAPYEHGEDGRVVVGGAWQDGTLLGGALLFHHVPDQRVVELGCWVIAAGEGVGLAAASCRVVLGLARSQLRAERVEWHATTVNVRSRLLAERLGFQHEGTLRSSYVLRGTRLDTDVLSLVGTELDPFV